MRRSLYITAAVAGLGLSAFLSSVRPVAFAHCEVPCGIYDDHARVHQMLEDATTIAKAVDQLTVLEGKTDVQSINQMTRWVMTKEDHATKIQHTIAQYFLTQRVKPTDMGTDNWNDYVVRLTEHHAVMVAAMKTKQTVDSANVMTLKSAIEKLQKYYPAADHAHPHPHPHG